MAQDKEKKREADRRYREQNKERYRRYYEANREKILEAYRRYREKNLERRREVEQRYREKNTEKIREKGKRYREANPEYFRRHRLRRTYNITLEVYNTLIDGQSFLCALCERPDFEDGRPLHVDHDHKTGWVRGLLCNTCNRGLGNFSDDIERLQRAIDYLRLHNREGKLKVGGHG